MCNTSDIILLEFEPQKLLSYLPNSRLKSSSTHILTESESSKANRIKT